MQNTSASARSTCLGFLAAFSLCVLGYSRSFGHTLLHWDDDRIVAGDPFLRTISWGGLVDFFAHARNEAYQPLHRLGYWLDVPWFGLDASVLHVTNGLLWSLGAAVWFLVFRRARLSVVASLFATLWFALHPIQVEAVSWITGRKDCLALLFSGLSCLAFCTGRHAWSCAAYLAAVLSKTTSLPLPLVFVLWEWTAGRAIWPAVRKQLPALLCMLALGALVFSLWHTHALVRPPTLNRALLVVATLGHYVKTALWPLALSPLYAIWYGPADIPDYAWWALASFAASCVWLRRLPSARFALGAFVCLLLPVLNLVPLYFQLADRYLSLPLIALAFGLARLVDAARLRMPESLVRAGAVLCLAPLLVANVRYQSVWADDVALWREATRNEPRAFYAWLQLGHALRDRGDYPGSMHAYESAVGTQPTLVLGRSALFYAVAQHELGDVAQAEGLVARYQAALTRVDQLDLLARELIARDARNSAALVIQRILELGELTPSQLHALLTSARASSTPWVAKAIEVAIQGGQPATAALR